MGRVSLSARSLLITIIDKEIVARFLLLDILDRVSLIDTEKTVFSGEITQAGDLFSVKLTVVDSC